MIDRVFIRYLLFALTLEFMACGSKAKPVQNIVPPAEDTIVAAPRPPVTEIKHIPVATLYTMQEAMEDVLSSPLEFLGTSEWNSASSFPKCVYKNERVLVMDRYCTKREGSTFSTVVFSPSRGMVKIYAFAEMSKEPLSKLSRSRYSTFFLSSYPPPADGVMDPPLSFEMDYLELINYRNTIAGVHAIGACWEGEKSGHQRGCTHGFEGYGAEFVRAHDEFMQSPPKEWFNYIRHIVAQRKHPWAKPKHIVSTPASWVGRAKRFTRKKGLLFYGLEPPNVGHGARSSAVVPLSGDSIVVIANRRIKNSRQHPIVTRIAPSGKILWQRNLRTKGYRGGFEAISGIALADDGLVVLVFSYVAYGSGPVMRIVRLDKKGRTLWDWRGAGSYNTGTPIASSMFLSKGNTIALEGHIYVDGKKRPWAGELDLVEGKLLSPQ